MPVFSVIIPAYNHASFLREAVQSVLNQTCQDFEVIVVDDASTDATDEVMRQFPDPRVNYVVHPVNRGLSATRNTGIKAASGDYLAFLDADDYFAPEKLELHLKYLRQHPDIGVTYNARFELNHSSKTIRDIWQPPPRVGLSDFVLGFPFAPSDMVLRKEWPQRVGFLDESYVLYSEDLYFYCQLALAGCEFGGLPRALNYRRYHSGRIIKGIPLFVKDYLQILQNVFADPRCPPSLSESKDTAFATKYLLWGLIALAQNETCSGQSFLRSALQMHPSWITSGRQELIDILIEQSIVDDTTDHAVWLRKILEQLPAELVWLSEHYTNAIAQGYMLKGIRAYIWGRAAKGQAYMQEAGKRGAKITGPFLGALTSRLINYETEYGAEATRQVIQTISPSIRQLGGQASLRQLIGSYSVNRAFNSYRTGTHSDVPGNLLRAVANDPSYLHNRGVMKIFLMSILHVKSNSQS